MLKECQCSPWFEEENFYFIKWRKLHTKSFTFFYFYFILIKYLLLYLVIRWIKEKNREGKQMNVILLKLRNFNLKSNVKLLDGKGNKKKEKKKLFFFSCQTVIIWNLWNTNSILLCSIHAIFFFLSVIYYFSNVSLVFPWQRNVNVMEKNI